MPDVRGALRGLRAELKAAGLPAELDPEKLTPTSGAVVWLQPREITDPTLAGGGTLVCWCYLIVPNVETEHAMRLLDDGLEGLLPLVSLAATDTSIDLAAAVVLPGQSQPLPAYRVAVDLDL